MIGAAISVGLFGFVAASPAAARLTGDGWRLVRPSFALHATFGGCLVLLGLLSYVALSGGSLRPDADEQNVALVIVLIGFGAMALFLAWSAYWVRPSWRGDTLRLATPWTLTELDLSEVRCRSAFGLLILRVPGGKRWFFSDGMRGAAQLQARISGKGAHPA